MNQTYKVGDVVIVNSPYYKIKKCKGMVMSIKFSGGVGSIKVLDDTVYGHGNFRKNGLHNLLDNCEVIGLYREPVTLPEDLFTL